MLQVNGEARTPEFTLKPYLDRRYITIDSFGKMYTGMCSKLMLNMTNLTSSLLRYDDMETVDSVFSSSTSGDESNGDTEVISGIYTK